MSDAKLNPHNYKEGRFKYPINHKDCERTIYFYKHKPSYDEIPAFEWIQRISFDQPVPELGGVVYCPHCRISTITQCLTIDEALEMD